MELMIKIYCWFKYWRRRSMIISIIWTKSQKLKLWIWSSILRPKTIPLNKKILMKSSVKLPIHIKMLLRKNYQKLINSQEYPISNSSFSCSSLSYAQSESPTSYSCFKWTKLPL